MKKLFTLLLALALALSITACGTSAAPGSDGSSQPTTQTDGTQISALVADGAELGEGEASFLLTIVDMDGKEIAATIHTDETTVGAALLDLGIIEGEPGEYGLYVTSVNGTTLDYAADGAYWAFYIDGEYAMTGVDMTEIAEGSTYKLAAEKA